MSTLSDVSAALIASRGRSESEEQRSASERVVGNHLRLPNATVFKGTLINYSRNPRRRFDFAVGVGCDEDLAEAQGFGLEVLHKMPGVMDKPGPFSFVEELGDSAVALRYYGWVDQRQADYLKVKSQSIRLVKERLDHEGVDLPTPIYQVQMSQDQPEERERKPKPDPKIEEIDVTPQDDIADQVDEDRRREGEGKDLLNDKEDSQVEEEMVAVSASQA